MRQCWRTAAFPRILGGVMQFLGIVLLALAGGVSYGILHDQVTARVCVEYFTIGHPPLVPTESPTLLALAWGVVATWWVALPLGFALAIAARAGSRPKRSVRQVVRPLLVLLGSMFAVAAAAGVAGYLLVSRGTVPIAPWVAENIPEGKQVAFMADWWAHQASYASGILGGALLCIFVWRRRKTGEPRTS